MKELDVTTIAPKDRHPLIFKTFDDLKKSGLESKDLEKMSPGSIRRQGYKEVLKARSTMFLNIDYGLCQGCGGCAEAYPMFFEMRDDKAWVINADKFKAEEHKDILLVCPYYAITIEQG